jgi:hypothetical protein
MVTAMSCDCPEEQPRPTPTGGCNYVVHSAGPLSRFYRLVEQAIPEVELAHGRPTIHADGSLEFSGPPPEIAGYRREGNCLYPAWPPCTLRMLRVQAIDATLQIDGLCGNPQARQFGGETAIDQCRDCRARQS